METSNGKKVGVAAVAIAIIALASSFFGGAPAPTEDNVGGERAGLQEFIDGIKSGQLSEKWISKKLDASQSSVLLYRNTTGHDVIIDIGSAIILTGETASSTSKISIVATTSASIGTWADFGTLTSVANKKFALVEAYGIATSTTATTTNSVLAAVQNKGNGAVLVPNESYVFGFLQQDTVGCGITLGICETATSTSRGFNPVFNIRIRSTTADKPTL